MPVWIPASGSERRHRHEHPKTSASEDRSEERARTGASASRGIERSLRADHRLRMRRPSLRGRRMTAVLRVDDLKVSFTTEDGVVEAVGGVSFELAAGEILAIVGESGSGKSVTAQTLTGLTRAPNAKISGSITYRGRELVGLDDELLRDVRGEQIAMVFQDPMTSLNPVYRVGRQIAEMIRAHRDVSHREAEERAVELLRSV